MCLRDRESVVCVDVTWLEPDDRHHIIEHLRSLLGQDTSTDQTTQNTFNIDIPTYSIQCDATMFS